MKTAFINEASRPWYKQPWLWFVLSIPIASVVLSSIMVTVAVVGKDSLVSDNYYKDGMAINQTIEQDNLAIQLGIKPHIRINGLELSLSLSAQENIEKQAFLTLKLLHPTVSAKDIELKLLPSNNYSYLGELPYALEGRRYLDLYAFDQSWRIRQEVIFPQTDFEIDQHLQ